MQYDPQALWSADIFTLRVQVAPGDPRPMPDPVTDRDEAQAILDQITAGQARIEVVEPDADGWPPSMAEPGGVWLVRLPVFWFNLLQADGYIDLRSEDGSRGFYLESGE